MQTHNTSKALFTRSQKVVPGGVHSPARAFQGIGRAPFVTQSAKGAYLSTVDGTILLDYVGAFGPAIHGHNHPAIKNAILEALEKGLGYGTMETYSLALSEKVVQLVPSIEKVRMVNSGTEATMSALRLARGYTGRNKIVKFAGCYHGHSDGLLVKAGSGALTYGSPDSAGVPQSYAQETLVIPLDDLTALKNIFAKEGPDIAALILEPYPGNCGLLIQKPGFLETVRALCTQNGTVLIFDEVMTGFRVSIGGAQAREGILPDLTCLGKIIGGGLPVGAFGGKAKIMDMLSPLGPVYQAGTMSGNPITMAAGLASLELLEKTNPYPYLEGQTQTLCHGLQAVAKEVGIPLQTPQVGSMFSLFFAEQPVRSLDAAMKSNIEAFKKVFGYCLDHGIFLPPSPFETCFLSTAHTEDMIERTITTIKNALKSL